MTIEELFIIQEICRNEEDARHIMFQENGSDFGETLRQAVVESYKRRIVWDFRAGFNVSGYFLVGKQVEMLFHEYYVFFKTGRGIIRMEMFDVWEIFIRNGVLVESQYPVPN